MTTNPFDDNPYQSPTIAAERDTSSLPAEDRDILIKFRQEIVALGALWIFLGLAAIGIAAFLLAESTQPGLSVTTGLVLATGCLYVVIGILACCKQIVAVYTGLGLGYLSVIGNLFNLNLMTILIIAALGILLIQAHRVTAWASHLRGNGVPLSTKP